MITSIPIYAYDDSSPIIPSRFWTRARITPEDPNYEEVALIYNNKLYKSDILDINRDHIKIIGYREVEILE
jgi:hypothetical protein